MRARVGRGMDGKLEASMVPAGARSAIAAASCAAIAQSSPSSATRERDSELPIVAFMTLRPLRPASAGERFHSSL